MTNPFRELYAADQADRPVDATYGPELMARDATRMKQLHNLIDDRIMEGGTLTGEELVCAAMLYHHQGSPEHTAMAHLLAWQAHELGYEGGKDVDLPYALWLAAAARDRWQLAMGLPQYFGTQFELSKEGYYSIKEPYRRETTDEEREAWRVESLAAMQARAREMSPNKN